MRYYDPDLSHEEVVSDLTTEDYGKVTTALISIGLNEIDGAWAQEVCLKHVTHDKQAIASAAIVAIGHIARRFKTLDMTKVYDALLYAGQKHPSLSGVIGGARDDIEIFT